MSAFSNSISVIRDAAKQLSPVGRAAAALALLAVILVAVLLPSVVGSLFTPSARAVGDEAARTRELAAAFQSDFEPRVAQFNGRSLFFIPGAPPPPEPPPSEVVENELPPPPPPPATYGGPAIIAMVNGSVWFTDGRQLAAGGEADGDLKVERLQPPWSAVVRWKDVEFTVDLFTRDSVVMPPPAINAGNAEPGPTPSAESAEK